MECRTTKLPDFWWDAINSCCFATLECFYGFSQLFEGGWFIELFNALYSAISTEEGLEVLGPASKDGGVVSEKVLSV